MKCDDIHLSHLYELASGGSSKPSILNISSTTSYKCYASLIMLCGNTHSIAYCLDSSETFRIYELT